MKATPIVERHYQLILWMLPKMAKFPKDQRFLLADRIERLLLDILEILIEAVYSSRRRRLLMDVNLKLDVLRFMMRIACDMHYVNVPAYDYFCQSVLEIGRTIPSFAIKEDGPRETASPSRWVAGGWLKTTAGKDQE